jgi:redox-sensing transcriptional repressor
MAMAKYEKIPEATVRRLSNYLKCLLELESKGQKITSSVQIADICNVNPAQVRKDLAYFGEFGVRGKGYKVRDLILHIREILGINREWRIAVVGIGNLGSALLVYKDFLRQNYKIVAAFDIEPEKVIGRISERVGRPVEILHVDRLKDIVKERDVEIGIITVPPDQAQKVADQLVDANVKGILNLSPVPVKVPPHVKLRNIFFTSALDSLVYYLSNRE